MGTQITFPHIAVSHDDMQTQYVEHCSESRRRADTVRYIEHCCESRRRADTVRYVEHCTESRRRADIVGRTRPVNSPRVDLLSCCLFFCCTGCLKKCSSLKLCGIFALWLIFFCVKFCKFVSNSYPHISADFWTFVLQFYQMALI